MAFGFNSTWGMASTDKVMSAYTTGIQSGARTYMLWVKDRAGQYLSRLFVKADFYERAYIDTNGNVQYQRATSGTFGSWTWAYPFVGDTWQCVILTYDCADYANKPELYIAGTQKTRTDISQPTGTRYDSNDPFCIGNHADGNRVWDGGLAEFAIWNHILNSTEIAALSSSPPTKLASDYPTDLVEYLKLRELILSPRSTDSTIVADATVTGCAVITHPFTEGGFVPYPISSRGARGGLLAASGGLQ